MARELSDRYLQGLTDVSSKYGAPLGRADVMENPTARNCRCYRLAWVSYDYDRGGAYWGGGDGSSIYRIVDREGEVDLYIRARSRDAAVDAALLRYPGLHFRPLRGATVSSFLRLLA